MQFKSLFVFASLAIVSFAQTTPAQVESDINNTLTPTLAADVAAIDAFPISGGTLDQAMAIHTLNTELSDDLLTAANDINDANCPFPDSDASDILALLEASGPTIQKFLTDIVARKPGFDAIGATSLIQQDLTTLKMSSDAMSTALINCVSPTIAPEAQAFMSAVDAALAPALNAFNN